MLAARLKNMFFTLLAVEVLSSTFAFVACCFVLYSYPHVFPEDIARPLFFLIAVYLLALLDFLVLFYRRIMRFADFSHSLSWEGFFSAQASLALLGMIFLTLTMAFSVKETTLVVIAFTSGTMLLLAATHTITSACLHRLYNQPANRLKVLVVGMNRRTLPFCKVLRSTPHLGAEVFGYLDEKPVENDDAIPYLGRPEHLGPILRDKVIDAVFIFLPVRSFYDAIRTVIETSGYYGVTAHIVGNLFEADTIKKQPLCINDFGAMAFSSTTVDYISLAAKRVVDIVLSGAALVFLSPLLLLVAAYIKLVSPGPAIFRQERIGLNKRSFCMFKFRTMVPNAEARQNEVAHLNEMDGPVFKIANDPRLIRGGAFLRRHSLDELPQLWNVLRGDMSVVGPRPLSRRDFDLLKEDWQRKRFSMRPGLTCIWQVTGRNEVTFREWMLMDLEYVDRWNLGLDVMLILKTIRAVFAGGGK